jgi:predicted Fe-Mo cluster-binding NifX family protein
MTRFAVPVESPNGLSSKVNEHFARSEHFAILDAKNNKIVSVKVLPNTFAKEGQKKTAEFIADNGVEVVLAGRIGSCMMSIFQDRGIRMFSGAEGSVRDAFKNYGAGKLTEVRHNKYLL